MVAVSLRVLVVWQALRLYVRVVVCVGLALVVALGLVHPFLMDGRYANDFQWPYAAAVQLRYGVNPYYDLGGMIPSDFYTGTDPLFYPLPAVLLALPLSYLPATLAGTLFSGVSAFLLAWGVTSSGEWWRLLVFTSPVAWIAFGNVQWSPLLLASVYLWWLSPLAICKPSIGFSAFVAAPRWFALAVAGGVLGISLLVLPSWPLDWFHNLRSTHHPMPMLYGWPFLLALSVWFARRRDGRVFFAWSLAPGMVFFYDTLLLYVIPRSWRQMLLLSGLAWLAVLAWGDLGDVRRGAERPLEYLLMTLPALGLVVFNNRDELPWNRP